jgi:hypothetical protein
MWENGECTNSVEKLWKYTHVGILTDYMDTNSASDRQHLGRGFETRQRMQGGVQGCQQNFAASNHIRM